MRKVLLWLGLVLALGVPNALIVDKERALSGSTVVLLELAPVDPRSLIQGDYMALAYAEDVSRPVVIQLDAGGVAHVVRPYEGALGPGELLLRGPVTREFFFQEGHADRYAAARYGEFSVAPWGQAVLTGLSDRERRKL